MGGRGKGVLIKNSFGQIGIGGSHAQVLLPNSSIMKYSPRLRKRSNALVLPLAFKWCVRQDKTSYFVPSHAYKYFVQVLIFLVLFPTPKKVPSHPRIGEGQNGGRFDQDPGYSHGSPMGPSTGLCRAVPLPGLPTAAGWNRWKGAGHGFAKPGSLAFRHLNSSP